jgi:hypothetical protein
MTFAGGKRIELELYCNLTDDEVQSRGLMLVEAITERDQVDAARREAGKRFKDKLVGLDERQRKLGRVIRERAEHRMVQCMVLFHMPVEATKRIVRLDTGEVVREEPMTQGECQLNMFASIGDLERMMEAQAAPEPEPGSSPESAESEPPEDAGRED